MDGSVVVVGSVVVEASVLVTEVSTVVVAP